MRPPLRMRAWTQRQGPGTDPYGGGGPWVDHLTGVDDAGEPCSWWTSSGAEQVNPQRTVTIAGEFVRFDRLADVRAGDRIRRLVDHQGRVIFDNAAAAGLVREIEFVAARRDHVEAKLRSTS